VISNSPQESVPSPLVSVILPTFNRKNLLPRSIQSVLEQSFRDLELLVVDDGSSDGTSRFVRSIEDERVRSLRQTNKGVSSARNLGISQSKGTYLALLDSDDEWMPSKLENQIEALESNPSYLAVHTNEIWYREGKFLNQKKRHRKRGGWIFPYCLPLCLISPSSILLHKRLFPLIGKFREDYPVCEDYELWLRLTARFPILFLDEPLVIKHGGHPDQLSRKYWGMDRFRSRALEEIINSGFLTPAQIRLASRELRAKCLVLEKGFRKRGKVEDAEKYRLLAREKDENSGL